HWRPPAAATCWRPAAWSWPTIRRAAATTPRSRERTWEHERLHAARHGHRGRDRWPGDVLAVRMADLGGRRVGDFGAQGLRRAGWPDPGPAAVSRGSADRLAAARAPR